MNCKNSNAGSRGKSSTSQLEFHVAAVYDQVCSMLQHRPNFNEFLPSQISTAHERVTLLKQTIKELLEGATPKTNEEREEGNIFTCADCETYEKNLQKLEGEVRNHIRTHQQLRLYQDGLEEKIEELKKEKKESDRKVESGKKKYEEMKSVVNSNLEKISKLEAENEKLRAETKESRPLLKAEDSKRLTRYESNKENLGEWRNHGPRQDRERGSVEKRAGSSERMRVSVNVRSSKGLPVSSKLPISSKIIQEKTKEEKAKVLKSRIGLGY